MAQETVDISTTNAPIIFFDGTCNLCNGFVQFIIRHDKKKIFLFAPLQSETGREAIKSASLPQKTPPDSVILFYKGVWHIRSAAALQASRLLGWPWIMLYTGIIIPRFLRDAVYNLISRNRYKWFGKRNECMIPTPDILERFLSK